MFRILLIDRMLQSWLKKSEQELDARFLWLWSCWLWHLEMVLQLSSILVEWRLLLSPQEHLVEVVRLIIDGTRL